MAVKVNMPKQGLQMTEGTIISWLAREGDGVKEGEPLFEMETDKLTIEISSPASGTLLTIVRGEGEVVPITELIAVIGEEGEDVSDIIAEYPLGNHVGIMPHPADAPSLSLTASPMATGVAPTQSTGDDKVFASPRARWKAGEAGIDVDSIIGSGPVGLIIERDVLAAKSSKPKATALAQKAAHHAGLDLGDVAGSGPRGKVYRRDVENTGSPDARIATDRDDRMVKFSGMRKVISRRMRESLDTAAQAVHRIDVDMSEVVRMRSHLESDDIPISYNDVILKSVAVALTHHPRMNSRLVEGGILELGEVNVGMAVAIDDGLLVPVIRNIDQLALADIRSESQRLVESARSNGLDPDELQGGTFSVSNLGMYDIDSFMAIINSPESGILAVGAVKEKAVVVAGKIIARFMCSLSLTYDHRVIDGAPAAKFLREIKTLLENPYRLL